MSALRVPPLSLYVHLPWCVRKCPYCDFNSHVSPKELPEQPYVDALLKDLEFDLPGVWGRTVVSVFLGGGTPSLFSPSAIETLLNGIRARVNLEPGAEITMEANPGTLEYAPLDQYRDAGINRLSLGVQSFDDQRLQAIGRIHSADEARGALERALGTGFESINVDLMYGLPGQSVDDAANDVETAIGYCPDHLSHYQLTIESNTLFHRRPPAGLPNDDLAWTMQQRCQETMDTAGYRQYEISAYARADSQCRHNLNYWQFGDYLGIGAGAHAKLTRAADGVIERTWKQRHPRTYLEHAGTEQGVGERWTIGSADRLFEFALNVFRLNQGVPEGWFEARTGLILQSRASPWLEAVERGWVQIGPEGVCATDEGRRLLNDLQGLFLAEQPVDVASREI